MAAWWGGGGGRTGWGTVYRETSALLTEQPRMAGEELSEKGENRAQWSKVLLQKWKHWRNEQSYRHLYIGPIQTEKKSNHILMLNNNVMTHYIAGLKKRQKQTSDQFLVLTRLRPTQSEAGPCELPAIPKRKCQEVRFLIFLRREIFQTINPLHFTLTPFCLYNYSFTFLEICLNLS